MYFTAENLYKKFDSVTVDVSLACEKGTLTSIVGASGSGKSTVLRMISGLLEVEKNLTNGTEQTVRILLDNVDVTNLHPSKRQIGMVFQSRSLFDHMDVCHNVAYGLISGGMKKKEALKKACEFLPMFGLDGFEKRMPSTLSGGEAQRVSLARTLIMNPKLVLFDEPLSALDAPLRKKLAQLIKDLQKSFGYTGIMVTHDITEAKTVSDNIILMKKGHICWQGKATDFDEKMMEND